MRVAPRGEMVLIDEMKLLPAIDLMGGEVVRLEQGKADRKTVYSKDPAAMARRWQDEGGDLLHVVDLDAAFTGEQRNLEAVRQITQEISIPCELGGGIRSLEAAEAAFSAGVSRVIIGSKACQEPEFLRHMITTFGSERVAVGIDAKDGYVATHGWVEVSSWRSLDLARRVMDCGVTTLIYTDIATDGMFTGPNLAAQQEMIDSGVPQVIASGGVGSLDDIKALASLTGLHGVIMGKALYDGRLDLAAAATWLKSQRSTPNP
ncbi:MAG: 1-(5-phosphoribosyl)-5-[(5-phosphoribosylamino)methylideneamino]imidazole-4-carboxamide isomerase [Candidatus Methylacidiphilales bacterium]